MELERFVEAQRDDYNKALTEIQAGAKCSHWMWYIFPQIEGLGHSRLAQFYAIKSRTEAQAYLSHPVLGQRLMEITKALLTHKGKDVVEIMGAVDALKLRSSMTLFSLVSVGNSIFCDVIHQFFDSNYCEQTIKFINRD